MKVMQQGRKIAIGLVLVLAAGACGSGSTFDLPGTAAVSGGEADGEVEVNAGPSPTTGAVAPTPDSASATAETGVADGTTAGALGNGLEGEGLEGEGVEGEGVEGDGVEGDGGDPAGVAEAVAEGAEGEEGENIDESAVEAEPDPVDIQARIEVAEAAAISLVADDARMSTNLDRPTQSYGHLTLDGAETKLGFDNTPAEAGFKWLFVDYQLLVVEGGNFQDPAFSVEVDGAAYTPANDINLIIDTAQVVNSRVVFAIPKEATVVRLRGGVPSGSDDGFMTEYEIALTAFDATAQPATTELAEDDIETLSTNVQLLEGDGTISTHPSRPEQAGQLFIDGARTTIAVDTDRADEASKFVVIDYHLIGRTDGNFQEEAFRLMADGEWYSTRTSINLIINPGQVVNNQLIFEVPQTATETMLEGGVPAIWDDGFRSTYEISFPEAGESPIEVPVLPEIPDDAIETLAADIELISDDAVMDMTTARPGLGELSIDRVATSAKIDGDGAGAASKFVIIDYQMLALDGGNFQRYSFRLRAEDEWYPILTDINLIVDPGQVRNSSMVFRVPRTATDLVLESGIPLEWNEGATALHRITLPPVGEPIEIPTPGPFPSDAEVEASAKDIRSPGSLVTSIAMSRPQASGTVVVDAAATAAKIEADGAGADRKFLIVDYTVTTDDWPNHDTYIFRALVDGERYSPVNNRVVSIGKAVPTAQTVYFRIPRLATSVTLEVGVPGGWSQGQSISFEIEL